jgi:hypothetical protein
LKFKDSRPKTSALAKLRVCMPQKLGIVALRILRPMLDAGRIRWALVSDGVSGLSEGAPPLFSP